MSSASNIKVCSHCYEIPKEYNDVKFIFAARGKIYCAECRKSCRPITLALHSSIYETEPIYSSNKNEIDINDLTKECKYRIIESTENLNWVLFIAERNLLTADKVFFKDFDITNSQIYTFGYSKSNEVKKFLRGIVINNILSFLIFDNLTYIQNSFNEGYYTCSVENIKFLKTIEDIPEIYRKNDYLNTYIAA